MLAGAADFVTKPFRADVLRRVCELATRREDYLLSNAQVVERMESLQQLRNLLENIVDSMPSVLIGVDQQGQINLWNRGAERISEVSADFAKGKLLEQAWPEFRELEEVRFSLLHGEIRKLSKVPQPQGDKTLYCDITIYPLYETSVIGAVIRIDDVTERVLLEERIMQSEKMVSMGQLATGLAHEINNPLASVLQNIQVARQRLAEESPANSAAARAAGIDMASLADYLQRRDVGARLDAVMESGKRAAQLIENMLNFGRSDTASLMLSDMAELVDKSVELAVSNYSLQKKFDFRTIEIQRDFAQNLPLVECNPLQIQQVFFNLLMNGAQAMEGKLLEKRSESGGSDYQPRFVLRTSLVNRRVRIEIEDNGSGMDEITRSRIFEPFYTTQKIGAGTGLGLSICYFIVTESHRGRMLVDSKPGVGTRFILEFPQKK
jgi:PAS domain S-box-containing protein